MGAMRKDQVSVGASYVAKVSGQLATVRIVGESRYGGWDAVSVRTGRSVRIKTAGRLRSSVDPAKSAAIEERRARAQHGTGTGDYADKASLRAKGSCYRCGRAMQKPDSLFCNRACYRAYFEVPSEETLRHWSFDGVAEATDGCSVEPDGTCPHGRKSWLLVFGLM